MSTSFTLGVKVEPALKERLQVAAMRMSCSPHALHKRALTAFLDQLERGQHVDAFGSIEEKSISEPTTETNVFADLYSEIRPQSFLRQAITAAYRRPEQECVPLLLCLAEVQNPQRVENTALALVNAIRGKRRANPLEELIQAFSLSTHEGIALMCLAEALLRIPDHATRDALIRDKISKGNWRSHLPESHSMFVSAATWGLLLSGKLVSLNSEQNLSASLTRMIGKGGEPLIRKGVDITMRLLGEHFVCGQSIAKALSNGSKLRKRGFRYSFDMLGEAAMTDEDAQRYFVQYEQAIHAIGKASRAHGIYEGDGISIKLSALHPRYCRAKHQLTMRELYPRLLHLIQLGRQYDIGVNIDAEEADRLDISLDILEKLCHETSLAGWNGIGMVIQAYQKRALAVVNYVVDLAQRSNRRIMVRLVKGAYWDTEIKRAQIDGLEDYPVFTRKVHTDVSYLACARRLLEAQQFVFPQFATHNAHTVAAILHMAGENYYRGQYEFQCLHGMGEPLYEEVIKSLAEGGFNRPCRIYAPVGTHETLLPYLVRRLLENGANSSFVNQIHDPRIRSHDIIRNPVDLASKIEPVGSSHPKIPLPINLYKNTKGDGRSAARGIDLSNESRLTELAVSLLSSTQVSWHARPLIANTGQVDDERVEIGNQNTRTIVNPADTRDIVGIVQDSTKDDIEAAVLKAINIKDVWQATPALDRVAILERAADLLETNGQRLIGLIVREAGKTLPAAIGELREAVDFLRYYAQEAQTRAMLCQSYSEQLTTDPAPLGLVCCISPWNFPLAIFTGQVAAALVTANVVLAKPAEQTCLIAFEVVRILHEAGVPKGALQYLPGMGETIGAQLTGHREIDAVIFTGSNATAQLIQRSFANRLNRHGRPVTLIAETGGLNAMLVDSSALSEQVVIDVITSAFDSAGQRCSALRVLLLQDDNADITLKMLRGAIDQLTVANPAKLSTDIGPVIDSDALKIITQYISKQRSLGQIVYQGSNAQAAGLGNFVPPTMIEIDCIDAVSEEIFGPILHVMRYKREGMKDVLAQLNKKGYGLTFGIHTRIDETSRYCVSAVQVGNAYVNRNIIGASVGVQPFGGHGLSGTGPKAGGPLYLGALCEPAGQLDSLWLAKQPKTDSKWLVETELAGPTGERNIYQISPRGSILCLPKTDLGLASMLEAIKRTGNQAKVLAKTLCEFEAQLSSLSSKGSLAIEIVDEELEAIEAEAILFEGDADQLIALQDSLANRTGAIVPISAMRTSQIQGAETWPLHHLVREKSVCINTAAAGGNASLMALG
jgi:RHH-type proline utilization regulon transcriptional repressor/proline dehydrogenase/delta 1-pyrroline-5-carboxylate dehydrogenase